MSDDWKVTDTLTDWWVRIEEGDGFTAPELRRPYLGGKSKKRNGKTVQTSFVIDTKGRLVKTSSGSVYELGRVNKNYYAWCLRQGFKYDKKNPVKMKTAGKDAAA